MRFGDPMLGLVTDILRGMARAEGAMARVDAVLGPVARAVDAPLGLLLRADAGRATVQVLGRGMPEGVDARLGRELELLGADPLLDPVAGGDLAPRTAERAFGAAAWASSVQRAGCLRLCGVDQVATLPLVGGRDLVIAMVARRGEDFSEDDLRVLTEVRPMVADLVSLTGVGPLRGVEVRPHLTLKETEVLTLLARGDTCARIARTLGASPRTVEVHLGRIYAKLGVSDRLSAVLAAYDLALIPPRGAQRTTATG
jgi:DNA-binding CsgD family transcriptional regulator